MVVYLVINSWQKSPLARFFQGKGLLYAVKGLESREQIKRVKGRKWKYGYLVI